MKGTSSKTAGRDWDNILCWIRGRRPYTKLVGGELNTSAHWHGIAFRRPAVKDRVPTQQKVGQIIFPVLAWRSLTHQAASPHTSGSFPLSNPSLSTFYASLRQSARR